MIGAISTALTGLLAASKKVEASAANIANMGTSGSLAPNSPKQPYQALTTVQTAMPGGGVSAANIPQKPGFVNAYAPDSPFAGTDGMVGAPDVDLAAEAVNLKIAELSYKANMNVLKTANEMSEELSRLLDEKA